MPWDAFLSLRTDNLDLGRIAGNAARVQAGIFGDRIGDDEIVLLLIDLMSAVQAWQLRYVCAVLFPVIASNKLRGMREKRLIIIRIFCPICDGLFAQAHIPSQFLSAGRAAA